MNDAVAAGAKQVLLQRIYVKDASLEVPQAPQVFQRPWKPNIDVQVQTAVGAAGEGQTFQVVLTVTVTAKLDDDVAFLAEVHQAGVFALVNITEAAERAAVLGAYCPNMLFPYAREAIASLIGKAGFPSVLLQPINFEAVYQQSLQQQRAQQATGVHLPPGSRPQ